jgi:RNA polymerase sigma-70 factor (ECF subfamily)
MNDPDLNIVKLLQNGDGAAFEELVKRYQSQLLNFVFRLIGDRQLAEDLVQEVFLRAYQAIPRYEIRSGKARFSTWMFKIAYNLTINELHRRKRQADFLKETYAARKAMGHENATDTITTGYYHKQILTIIANLPEQQKAALLLRVTQGLSYKEIADVLNRSVTAVESLIFRARKNLKTRLDETREE